MAIKKLINLFAQQMMALCASFKPTNLLLLVYKLTKIKINLQIWILFFKEKWRVASMKRENTIFI